MKTTHPIQIFYDNKYFSSSLKMILILIIHESRKKISNLYINPFLLIIYNKNYEKQKILLKRIKR